MPSEYEELWIDTSEFDHLATQLEQFPREVEQQMLSIATGAGATVFQLGLIGKAPTRIDGRTPGSTSLPAGYVKADVRVQKLKHGDFGRVGWLIGPSSLTAHVWRWLEYGHMVRLAKKLRGGSTVAKTEHVPAYPFIRPTFDEYWRLAYETTSKKLGELMADYLRRSLKRVA